jgi:hypothetical protein
MQVKQISLDFLGTFFIKEKGTKHIYSTNHLGKAPNKQLSTAPFIKEKGTKHIYSTNHPGKAQNKQLSTAPFIKKKPQNIFFYVKII